VQRLSETCKTPLNTIDDDHPGNCLHDLLPPERDPSVSHRLRHPTVYLMFLIRFEQNGTAPL